MAGPLSGFNSMVTHPGSLAHVIGQAFVRAYNSTMHDPYLHYEAGNDYALAGVRNGPEWANALAGMRVNAGALTPAQLALMRAVYSASPVNAYTADPRFLQTMALRGLNPQDVRAP
jgi:hypothetical protein